MPRGMEERGVGMSSVITYTFNREDMEEGSSVSVAFKEGSLSCVVLDTWLDIINTLHYTVSVFGCNNKIASISFLKEEDAKNCYKFFEGYLG